MADPWKTEFHVIAKGGDTQAYLEDKDEAIAEAERLAEGATVMRVTSYLDDRKTVWPSDEEADEWD